MYNTTNITDANTVLGVIQATNQLSGYLLFNMLAVFLYFILIITFSGKFGFKTSMVFSSFAMVIIGGLFLGLNLISFNILIIFIIGAFVSIVSYLFID